MRIACLIDSLGSGGAERQLTELAIGLREIGHEVSVCYYHSEAPYNSFYDSVLENNGINLVKMQLNSIFSKVINIRRWLKSYKPDIVQAYLTGPSAIAVLTGIGQRNWKVVVSERSNTAFIQRGNLRSKAIAQIYRGADWIIANSHSNLANLLRYLPVLKRKSSVIWNGVDIEKFNVFQDKNINGTFHFICVASMGSNKNAVLLVEALDILKKNSKKSFDFLWVGRCSKNNPDHVNNMRNTLHRIEKLGLQSVFFFIGEIENIENEYKKADALVLVSLSEGLPNVICEGMASGLPVVASTVADNSMIIKEGENGFLCDPTDVNSIANALSACLSLDEDKLRKMGKNSRHKAEAELSRGKFIDKYEKLYELLLTK